MDLANLYTAKKIEISCVWLVHSLCLTAVSGQFNTRIKGIKILPVKSTLELFAISRTFILGYLNVGFFNTFLIVFELSF